MANDLMPQFKEGLAQFDLGRDERILVAVSGGPDSMALLHLFLRWDKTRIGVFHLDHGFRPEAAAEARFVADYAAQFSVPAHVTAYDINRYLEESGESKQQGARKIRYRLLRECALKEGYTRIALGHHGDDQAETVLMRLLRGSGLHGLGGIPPQRGPFIRPLLAVPKDALIAYCQAFGIPFVEDPSNFEPVYLRNKIRNELIPLLEREYNPEIARQLLRLAELARDDDLELQRQAEAILTEYSSWDWGQLVFPRTVFSGLSRSVQRRVLRALLFHYQGHLLRVDFDHIETWREYLLNQSVSQLSLPGVSVSATQDSIYVGEPAGISWEPQTMEIPGEVQAGPYLIKAEFYTTSQLPPLREGSEDFDFAALELPLLVRPRQAGDRLRPFGADYSKKVKDLLIEARIPVERRDFLPCVCDQREIIWIPGVRRGAAAPLTEDTERVLRLSFLPNPAYTLS